MIAVIQDAEDIVTMLILGYANPNYFWRNELFSVLDKCQSYKMTQIIQKASNLRKMFQFSNKRRANQVWESEAIPFFDPQRKYLDLHKIFSNN